MRKVAYAQRWSMYDVDDNDKSSRTDDNLNSNTQHDANCKADAMPLDSEK